jgi:hypothetical protein
LIFLIREHTLTVPDLADFLDGVDPDSEGQAESVSLSSHRKNLWKEPERR